MRTDWDDLGADSFPTDSLGSGRIFHNFDRQSYFHCRFDPGNSRLEVPGHEPRRRLQSRSHGAGPLTSTHSGRSLNSMLRSGILNPHLLSLLARVRHTNRLVIADSMFPAWPGIETVDLSLVYGIPTVPQVVEAIVATWKAGPVWMASEFHDHNDPAVRAEFQSAFGGTSVIWEPHLALKARVPGAVGLIRTGERRIYTNVVLESA